MNCDAEHHGGAFDATHNEVLKELALYAGGELPQHESESIEKHLALCLTCAKELQKYQEMQKTLQIARDPAVSEATYDRIWANINERISARSSILPFLWPVFKYAAVFVASISVGFSSYVLVSTGKLKSGIGTTGYNQTGGFVSQPIGEQLQDPLPVQPIGASGQSSSVPKMVVLKTLIPSKVSVYISKEQYDRIAGDVNQLLIQVQDLKQVKERYVEDKQLLETLQVELNELKQANAQLIMRLEQVKEDK